MSEKEQRGSTKLALKAGAWYVISSFLVKALSFVTTPIFARLMSSADYGEFSNYASWQVTLLIITSLELQNTLTRAYYDFTEDYDKYVSSVTALSFGTTAACYVIFLLCRDFIFNIVAIPKQFVHIMFFTLLCQACKHIFMVRERTLYRYKSVAAMSVINLVVPTLIAVAMVVMADQSKMLAARIYGFYVPSSCIGVVCAAVLINKGRCLKWEHCKYALKLSLPLTVSYLTAYLLTSSNTIVTKSVLGAEAASVISIASSAIHILTILLHALSDAVTTWIMDNLQQNKRSALRKGLLIYTAGIAVAAAGVILIAPEVIWVLGGTKYTQSVFLLPGMVVATAIQSMSTLFTIVLTYQKKVVKTALFTAIIAAVSIFAKVWLLPLFGVQILPYINMAAFMVQFAFGYVLVKQAGQGDIINIKGFVAIIALITAVMAASYVLYQHTLLRYGIILTIAIAVVAVGYRYRDILIQFVKGKLKRKKKA